MSELTASSGTPLHLYGSPYAAVWIFQTDFGALCITRYASIAPFAFYEGNQAELFSDFLAVKITKMLSCDWEGPISYISRNFGPVFQTYYEYKAENHDPGPVQSFLEEFVSYLRHAVNPKTVNGAILVPPEVDEEMLHNLFARHGDRLLVFPSCWVPFLKQLHVGQLSFFLCQMAFSGLR